jgi:hypothetical protein
MVAHGFRREKSILTNAKQHLNKRCLLKTDLKDFFHSISERRVIGIFRKLGYPPNVSFYLSRICCCQDRLPQGAATSPTLSNTIAYKMDNRLYKLSKEMRLKYTRYADDIAVSGNYISLNLLAIIKNIIEEEGFQINNKKTHLLIGQKKKIITGLSVSGELPKIPKYYKRSLRQELYYINKFGIYSHINERRIRDPFYANTIYGKLLFWKWVEPDNAFVNSHIGKIKSLLK